MRVLARDVIIFFLSQLSEQLTLASFKARVGFVNHIHAAFAAHKLAIPVTVFQRFQRTTDFHGSTYFYGLLIRGPLSKFDGGT